MAVVRHTDCVHNVGPGNGDEHRAKDFLARQAPVVRHIREDGGDRVVVGERGAAFPPAFLGHHRPTSAPPRCERRALPTGRARANGILPAGIHCTENELRIASRDGPEAR